MSELRVVVFGSKNLGAEHVESMAEVLAQVATTVGRETKLLLVTADDGPGVRSGAIGAPRLAEVAARLAWKGRLRGLRRWTLHRKEDGNAAEAKRDTRLVTGTQKPFRAVCFHTSDTFEETPGSGTGHLARALQRQGVGYLLVLLGDDGQVVREEERGPR